MSGAGYQAADRATGRAAPDWTKVDQFYDALLESLRQQPGVEAAGASNALPLEIGWRLSFTVEGRPVANPNDHPVVEHMSVTPGYFEAFRAPIVQGRAFARSDRADTEPVVIVNQTFARRFFPGDEPAVGKRLVSESVNIGPLGRNLPGRVPFRIVGVVADLHQAPLGQAVRGGRVSHRAAVPVSRDVARRARR